jgi:hypothetical protein
MSNRAFSVFLLIGTLAALSGSRSAADPPASITPADVAARIKQAKSGAAMSWTKIPWAASLLDARRASQAEKCPVFLFVHDGNISTGRC